MMKKDNFIRREVYSMCCLVFLIQGHQGFFIKHSGTGLCLKPANNRFDSGSWGQQYYVEFYDNCLHFDAQFRYVDKEYVVNIGKDGTLIARAKTRYQCRFLIFHPGNQGVKNFLRQSDHTLKQTALGSLITYQGTQCAIPKTLTTPSKGDQLIRTATCGTELQKFTFGSVTSHGATMIDVSCASSQMMAVVVAEYGAFSNRKTFSYSSDANCSLPVGCIVKNQCDSKTSCAITVNSSLFTFNQCPGKSKQLHMEYQCVDKLGIPITSVNNVRLSKELSQNQGFVEVFNGTTWRKLSDLNWDKRKQTALCRHLGYDDGESATTVKNIYSGEMILSGDLYCQRTQPSNKSCCAYLYPSTSTAGSNITYAKCKICDDPLLQNTTRFPDGIFSANDGNGYEVRLSNSGWCSTTSVSSYLQVDLKRDFYISYIATFGDKARTKWLELYELKYSSIVSGLDSKTGITITANNDAYRASITRLDVTYARYLKIIPKSGNVFCLRVELCGQVLLPDPVTSVIVDNPTRTAVIVSWSVPQNEGYDGVTYFLVSLNGIGQKHNISRLGDSHQYTFNNLKLYTSYTMTIEAGNAYGIGESISRTFATDDPGFFIKHSGTGLCLKPTDNYFDGGSWGVQYYVEFYDNCLHPDAQFRYVDKEYVVNIGKDGTLIARVKKRFLYRFLVYHPRSQGVRDYLRKPEHTLKQTASGSLITYQGTQCAIPKTLTTPSKGDQLIRTATCDTELQKFTFGSLTSHGATMIDISCATTQKMEVVMAEYGVFNKGTFDKDSDADCSLPVACKVVKGLCDGNRSCAIKVDSSLFPFNQCPGRSKRLHMEYRCVDNLGTPITSVSKVRLTQQPDQGFVEVFGGATWRKVNDENWDKRKQSALCHHYGLYNDSNVAGTGNIGAGHNLASGALYCQGTQPTNQSCCAYLYPSTSTAGSRIPYVKCKICDEPLLQNSTRFPNGVFSASAANGYDARLSNNGWCSSSSGTPYLQIDLHKDYYISHIATFGDKDQTKWVTSFLLQYSRTASGLGSSGREITITANHDGYRASITKVDIVYSRYLKFTSIKGNDFCLRIQLCGHVLLPDLVQSVVVDAITARSARVSWSLPQNEGHGNVTYFLVFLNGTKEGSVTRKDNNNQYTLASLKPFSNYEVTIEAGNVYGVGESVSETFKTNEAAPDGPPINVAVVSRSTSLLRVFWNPPNKNVSNGIITRYKICHSIIGVEESCTSDILQTSYDINNLQAATKYFLRIAAGTKIGYGTWTQNITKITNQGSVKPTKRTYSSLEIKLEKPRDKIQSILIIVQASSSPANITDEYPLNKLKPFENNWSVPYVTAGLSVGSLPKTFIIGDNKSYSLGKENYVNQPLKESTDYIVFLRFIETEKIYYSTDWSTRVETFKRPEGPLELKGLTLSSISLNISWKEPTLQKNVQFLAYYVCYKNATEKCISTQRTTYLINGLKAATKYEVRVRSETTAGNSEFKTITKFTDVPIDLSPMDLKAIALSSTSLSISWKQPNLQGKVQLSAYYICYKHTKETCTSTQSSSHIILNGLRPGTKYEVRVRSETTAGNSEFKTISKFTNDAPAEIPKTTYHSFDIKLMRSTESFKYLQIIVQAANSSQRSPDEYVSQDLKSYHDRATTSDPYITAELQSSKISSKIFTVGDGKWYNSTTSRYYNRLLEETMSYIVFVRFFEIEKTYYSTYWSSTIKIPIRPPAPNITKIVSYGRNGLKISWTQSSLPEDQTAINHIVSYRTSSNSATKETRSGSLSYILEGLEYETKYFISVQIETQAGRSEESHELSITTNSEPFSPPKESDNSYTIKLRKPKNKSIRRVQLIILQLQSESTIPKPAEEVQPVVFCTMDKEADNIAFTAKEFNMDDFKEDTIDVTLQLSDDKRRRRRASESNVVKGLLPNVTYRSSQWNYNAFGVSTKSYWSTPFEFSQNLTQQSRETSGKVATELSKECSKTSLYIVISISLVINVVLVVVVIYLYMRLRKRQLPAKDKVVVNIDNEVFSDDIYDEVQFPPSTCEPNVEKNTTNMYEELNLTDKKQDEHAYQSLVKNPVAEN